MLVDKSTPAVATLFDAIPHGKVGRQRGLGKILLLNVTHGLAQRVLLTKLAKLNRDVPCCADGSCPSKGR